MKLFIPFYCLVLLLSFAAAETSQNIRGVLQGAFHVDNRGAANFIVPVVVPPGVNGMQPSISVVHNSNLDNGVMGIGFELSLGYPTAITRGRSLLARDNSARGVEFSNRDKLYIDGERLIAQGNITDHWDPGTSFRHEIEDFSSITSYGIDGDTLGFEIKTKSGQIIHYGMLIDNAGVQSRDAYFMMAGEQDYAGKTYGMAYSYYVKSIADAYGNQITYNYENDSNTGEVLLDTILYGYNQNTEQNAFELKMSYEVRDDVKKKYKRGRFRTLSKRLDGMSINKKDSLGASTLIHKYVFGYGQSTATLKSLLKSITLHNASGALTYPINFNYKGENLSLAQVNEQADIGDSVFVTYSTISDERLYTKGTSTAYPIVHGRNYSIVQGVIRDVGDGVDFDFNDNGSISTIRSGHHFSYQYSGRRTDLSGRGDLGFHSFATFDHQTNLLNYQFLSQSFPMTGLVKREQTYRADNVVYDVDGNVTSLDLQPISSQDNDVVFDEVLVAPGGALTGSVFPFMSHSRELRWEFSIANPLTLDADDPESLFTEYNNEYGTNRALAHSEIETYVWFDEQGTASLPETELPDAFDDPSTAPSGAQDASPVGFMDWLTEVSNFELPQKITYGNIIRTRVDYSDGYRTDTHFSYYDPSLANGSRTDLVEWTQIVTDTPSTANQGSPVNRFTYNNKGKVETKIIDAQASNSSTRAASVRNAPTDTRLNTKETNSYTTTGLLEKTEVEDLTSNVLYDIDGGTKFTAFEVSEFDSSGRFPRIAENAYGHATVTTYDDYGRQTLVTDFNGEHQATIYDSLGRVIQTQDLLRNLTTTISFQETVSQSGVLAPQVVAVPSQISSTGLALTSKYYTREVNSGAVPVTTHYDSLGRAIRVIREGYAGSVTFTDTVYNADGEIVAVSNPYEKGSTAYWTYTTYDDAGRLATTTAPNGTIATNNYLGRLIQTTIDAPSLSGVDPAPQITTFLKSVRGETVKVWNADNVPTTISQTAGDEDPSLEFIYDGFGRMIETRTRQDQGDYVSVTATYDALGNQTQLVDPDKGQWDYVYDAVGRLRQQSDAKQTVTTNTFDILNRNLSRTITEANDGPVETTNWYYYDTAENSDKSNVVVDPDQQWISAVQREELSLAWTASPNDPLRNYTNANSFYYDDLGNNYLIVQNIDDKWFYTHTVFDSLNRPESVTYFWRPPHLEGDSTEQPGVWQSFGYSNTYDAESYITAVTDTHGKTWWEVDDTNGYDFFDRPAFFQKGGSSGAWTEKQYDPEDGNLLFITTGDLSGSSPQAGIQNNEYRYDGIGNLVYRSDGVRSTSEDFSYDVLNRLKEATVGSTTLSYTYHPNGNIKTKEDASDSGSGAYAYHATKVHAVTSAFGYSLDYDVNGNVKSRTGNSETWSFNWAGFDKPRWMGREETTDTRGSAFVYGPSQMRVVHYEFEGFDQSAGSDPSGWLPEQFTKKKLYLTGGAVELNYQNTTPSGLNDWEMQTVRVTIPAPDNSAGTAELDPNSPSPANHKYFVYHHDHLGSIQAITEWGVNPSDVPAQDDSGKDSIYSFDPWGQRRNADSWIGFATDQTIYTWAWNDPATSLNEADLIPRGYTGHEMLDELGLIHMNGRIYDPILGRFLTPDLVVQQRKNLQSFNRYSYTINNPLTYTDPTGYVYDPDSGIWGPSQYFIFAKAWVYDPVTEAYDGGVQNLEAGFTEIYEGDDWLDYTIGTLHLVAGGAAPVDIVSQATPAGKVKSAVVNTGSDLLSAVSKKGDELKEVSTDLLQSRSKKANTDAPSTQKMNAEKPSSSNTDELNSESSPKTKWQHITAWHDKRTREIFGNNNGRSFGSGKTRREYDATYKGRDIEYKSDNFSKGARSSEELKRMNNQIDKDIKLSKTGQANPHWHFEHDPSNVSEMKTILQKLEKNKIPWHFGSEAGF